MVPNGDFEAKRGSRSTVRPWRFVNTVDVIDMNNRGKMPIYSKDWNIPKPHSGDVMVGIRIYPNYREFLQIRLPEELEAGKRYYFEMWVHPLSDFKYYTKQLGASFYHRKPHYTSKHYIYQKPPQIRIVDQKGIRLESDTVDWIKLSGTFRSDGSEKYLSVGNFSYKRKSDRLKKKDWWIPTFQSISYYLIDDIQLYALENAPLKEQKLDPLAFIDSTYVLPDTLPYAIEDENYIYTIESKNQLILENIRFEFGSDKLIYSSYRDLELVLEYLNANQSASINIIGHTDNVGDDDANMKLSVKRAKAVYDYFVENKIERERLRYEGRGEKEPIATNETSQGKTKNRRVEIQLIKETSLE
jgi:outer membrane protein OmpA-like peptidoglycan-associated protein